MESCFLAGQTPIRVDGEWCGQAQTLEGMASFAMPDLILREDEMATALPALAAKLGHQDPVTPIGVQADMPFSLEHIYDAPLETLAVQAYQRDYLLFVGQGVCHLNVDGFALCLFLHCADPGL